MTDSRKILGIAGSLRKASYSHLAMCEAQVLLPAGVQLDIVGLDALALFNQDTESSPAPVLVAFKRAIRAADAILFATPEYNYGMPGVLKNTNDCARILMVTAPGSASRWQ